MPRHVNNSVVLALAAAAVALVLPAAPSGAEGKLDARYTASVAGVPVGKGGWVVDIGTDQYLSAVSGVTTGLLRVFASGEGSGLARGYVSNGKLVPSAYSATITTDKKTEELRMNIVGGVVKDLLVTPSTPPHPDRIPVTEAHLHGIVDPMTASLVRLPGSGDLISPEACNRTTPIFDGRLRYDLTVAFKRVENVKAEKGYEGPAVICAVYFNPVAGYIPNRAAIKYLTKLRDMEVAMVPVAGTRVLVPFRIVIPTPLGNAMLQATQFESTPQPPKPTPTSLKGQ